MRAEQGDLLRVEGLARPVIVVSNSFFNASGRAIVCPIAKDAAEGPLHIRIRDCPGEWIVLCEQVRYADLSARRFFRIGKATCFDVMEISDAVMGMFDDRKF